jgi:acetylornithine deacetylase/succinyl-diaminopimelate desuccinylase-like protein
VTKLSSLLTDPSIAALQAAVRQDTPRTIEEAITIQQIPAPTFDEGKRARYVCDRFQQLSLTDVASDDLHNVYGCLPGTDRSRPAVLLAAHTDTVFDARASLAVRREGARIYGPGLGDNSLGVAALLSAVELLRKLRLPADVWFVANSREEGMGDLGGIKAVYQRLKDRVGSAVILEGMAFGRVYNAGIAVRRLRISCHGQGGHSWLHFGRESAIHGLIKIGTAITHIDVPEEPRTTYNIGVIEGGTTVNSIATDASFLLDLRSEDRDTLAKLEANVREVIASHHFADLRVEIEVVGDRPAGRIPLTHPLAQLSRQVLESIGVAAVFEMGSTDANVPLAYGLPAVTIGITHGSNAHRMDEYIETPPTAQGLWQMMLLVVAAAHGLAM